jgi:transaldolase/glucose-6-phosphate isomerase
MGRRAIVVEIISHSYKPGHPDVELPFIAAYGYRSPVIFEGGSTMSTTVNTNPASNQGNTTQNPLKALLNFGQSVWLDYIRRDLLTTGELKRLIENDGLRGMTSNPSIFEKAITGSTLYAETLKGLESRKDLDAAGRYEQLAIKDIQDAADIFRPVYDQSKFRDGYVSLEVSPYLAHKTQETLAEARRLWKTVARPNVMIKVPGTPEGIPAFQQLISEGINVNVTLLFAFDVYVRVAEAYVAGLEQFVKGGGDPSRVASVASFFISRIDTLVDSEISAKIKTTTNPADIAALKNLLGKVAIANGKLTYQRYKQIFSGPKWDALAAKGAQTQRVLWASTSTKNPAYSDIYYVEELIGKDTVDTIPPATYDAFRDHGKPRNSLEENVEAAHQTMQGLEKAGISMKAATDKLTDDGVKQFSSAFDTLLAAVAQHTNAASAVKK